MTRVLRNLDVASRDELRGRAVLLKEAGHDYASIGEQLRVTTTAARDLCQQQRRLVRRQLSRAGLPLLPKSAIDLFMNGPYAGLVAGRLADRMKYLAKIGSLYTGAELLRERGLGRATLVRIENWLAAQGYRLRDPDESLSEAVCRLRPQNLPRITRVVSPSEMMSADLPQDIAFQLEGGLGMRYVRQESPPVVIGGFP